MDAPDSRSHGGLVHVALLALAAAAFLWTPLPFALVPGALLASAVHGVARSRSTSARKWCLAGASFALVLLVAELALPGPPEPSPVCEHDDDAVPGEEEGFDGLLGLGPPRGRVVPAAALRGRVGFDGSYSLDEHGLRETFPTEADRSVLFFGCSYTFGLNVADDETLPWLVGEGLAGRAKSYNFAYTGYGAQQMLANLQSGRVEAVVAEPPAFVFFQLIDSHVRRAVGNGWRLHDPRYDLTDEGRVVRNGRLCDPPEPSGFWVARLEGSAIWREATSHTVPHHVDTLVGILATARDEVEARFPGCRFEVVMWDKGTWKSRRLEEGLRAEGIAVHLVGDFLPGLRDDYDSWFRDGDNHPTPEANRRIAAGLVEHVRRVGGLDAD